jgi:CHAD domain-containing protein
MSSEPDGKKSPPPSPAQAEAYPEHDKLGPLPASPSRGATLRPGGDLHRAIVDTFRDAIDKARAASERAPDDLDDAVHEYRKSLRRARAVLALIRDELPADDAKELTDALRQARRAVSAARDHAVAPAAIAGLDLDDTTRVAAENLIFAARAHAPDRDQVIAHLVDGARRIQPTTDAVAAALPGDLDWSAIEDGIADTYRAARRALHQAKRSRRAMHAWRRRTKELSYQLELVAAAAGERTLDVADPITSMSDELGDVVDLIMLEGFVTAHAADMEASSVEAICKVTEDALRERSREARRHGKEVFARGGRKFARRVTKAVRRDLAPPPEAPAAEAPDTVDAASPPS